MGLDPMTELRELVIELDRLYYYGRHDAVGQQMAKIRQYLTDTNKPAKVTGDGAQSITERWDR